MGHGKVNSEVQRLLSIWRLERQKGREVERFLEPHLTKLQKWLQNIRNQTQALGVKPQRDVNGAWFPVSYCK